MQLSCFRRGRPPHHEALPQNTILTQPSRFSKTVVSFNLTFTPIAFAQKTFSELQSGETELHNLKGRVSFKYTALPAIESLQALENPFFLPENIVFLKDTQGQLVFDTREKLCCLKNLLNKFVSLYFKKMISNSTRFDRKTTINKEKLHNFLFKERESPLLSDENYLMIGKYFLSLHNHPIVSHYSFFILFASCDPEAQNEIFDNIENCETLSEVEDLFLNTFKRYPPIKKSAEGFESPTLSKFIPAEHVSHFEKEAFGVLENLLKEILIGLFRKTAFHFVEKLPYNEMESDNSPVPFVNRVPVRRLTTDELIMREGKRIL